MSSAITEMKKTLDANKAHVENALKETAHKAVKKHTPKPEAKPTRHPVTKTPTSKVHKVGSAKPTVKRFAEAYDRAVESRTTPTAKPSKPDVTVRVEVNNNQIPPWETASTVVSVQAPNMPETVVNRQPMETYKPTPSPERRYENSRGSDRSNRSPNPPAAVMGVLGSGFRPVSPTIKR